jgi:hypothetical protein
MDKRRHGWVRPVLVLAVLGAFAAAMVISPASAHITTFGHLKKHIKRIAKKVAKKQATTIVQTTVGPTLFVEETELQRFGPIELNIGQADQTIGAFGPFTLRASCDQPGGAGTPERARILITTSEDNSAFDSNDDSEDDFDAADPAEQWAAFTATTENVQEITSEDDGDAHAASPSGFVIRGVGNTLATSFSGSDCFFAGAVLVTAPN